ncbi:Lsr2 family protein [Streptomyces sp. NPDC048270]|uniref:histone-like nucleoid-structuring protein Lsr2 n=1 Tax=Streptomyces sp. NPDC048270 TaxID=3154615 RepID=UPI0033C13521
MAQKIVTIYTDDLTGEETQEAATHILVLDGIEYEIDLAPDSYDRLLEAVAPFTSVGRRAGRVNRVKATASDASRTSGDTAEIRAWAKANGLQVNDRGRVPKDVRDAYNAAE